MTIRGVVAGLALAGLTLTACGGSETPSGPTNPPVVVGPTVLGISPGSGPTSGGTTVTISGANFAAGAAVSIGGSAATSVAVVSSTSITAVTGASAAGAAGVSVTVDGRSSTLASAFTYVALPPPTISGISPSSGSTAGGTTIALTGTNFASGATVTLGGVAATGVTALSSTSLRAVTGPRPAGSADVVVAVGTQSATLVRGYTYVVPGPNLPPAIASLTVQSTRPNAPPDFADVNEDVPVTATVTDDQTPVNQLIYEWSATLGTISGTGASVRWRAPASASTPVAVTITLKVSEPPGGGAGSLSSTGKSTLVLHDSLKEISDMSRQFLLDFSDSTRSPSYVVRDFYDGCPGKAEELADVTDNRKKFVILSYSIGTANPVSVAFKSACAVPKYGDRSGDGCAVVQCEWHDKELSTGVLGTTTGPDYLTAVYRNNRWWLCNSDFPQGTHTNPVTGATFIR